MAGSYLPILLAIWITTALHASPFEDFPMTEKISQNPDRIQTVWEGSLRLEISGDNEVVEIRLENLTSRPLQYMTFGNERNSNLLPYGLLLKARDSEQQPLVTEDLDYWRGYWSPSPYPNDFSGLFSSELGPHSERKYRIDVAKLMQRVPFREGINDFKLMFCVFHSPGLEGYFGDTESPWIRYRPKIAPKPQFKSG